MCQALYKCSKPHNKNKEGIIIPTLQICKWGQIDGGNSGKLQSGFKTTAFFLCVIACWLGTTEKEQKGKAYFKIILFSLLL